MVLHVTREEAEDGWVVAEWPALPGCVSRGRNEKEALENIREAITGWMGAEDQKAIGALSLNRPPNCGCGIKRIEHSLPGAFAEPSTPIAVHFR